MDIKVESDDKRVKVMGRNYQNGAVYTVSIDDTEIGETPDLGNQPSYQTLLSYLITMGPTIRLNVSSAGMKGNAIYKTLLQKAKEKAEEEKKK